MKHRVRHIPTGKIFIFSSSMRFQFLILIFMLGSFMNSTALNSCETPIHLKPITIEEEPEFKLPEGRIYEIMDSVCEALDVNPEAIYNIKLNESGTNDDPNDMSYDIGNKYVKHETSKYDLQMIDVTWKYWSKKLNLKKPNRKNYLIACIHYFKYQLDRYDNDYYKARFAYGRGTWRPENTWKPIERRFMSKFTKFKTY